MTLTDRITAAFKDDGTHVYPIHRRIVEIVHQHRRERRPWNILILVLAFASGALLDYAWSGYKVTAINENLATWRKLYEHDYELHHDLKKVSKAQAQVIVQKREDERGGRP